MHGVGMSNLYTTMLEVWAWILFSGPPGLISVEKLFDLDSMDWDHGFGSPSSDVCVRICSFEPVALGS